PAPLIFIHIPKAAGTTLQEIIVRHYQGTRGFRFTGDPERVAAFRSLTHDQRDAFDLLQAHIHFGLHELLSRPPTYITILPPPFPGPPPTSASCATPWPASSPITPS